MDNKKRKNINSEIQIKKIKITDMVAPSRLKNYILNDPLIDYLEYYKINNITDEPRRKRANSIANDEFEEFIKVKGVDFEKKVMTKYPNAFHTIDGPISLTSFNETVKALKNNIPIIYQGVLYDVENSTYGCADLILRGDYLNLMYNQMVEPNLYYIVDIKYSTVKLSSDQKYILNSDFIPVYKSQIWIYTNALNKILNQNVNKGFILGKQYQWTTLTVKNSYNNENFNRIAEVDFNGVDKKYKQLVIDAVKWVLKLRSEGITWRLLPKPSVPELYPNMSNNRDGKWRGLKKELANEIKELTNIVYVTHEHRANAFKHNIFSYDNPLCNSNILGIKGDRGVLIDKILDINNSEDSINPILITNSINNWRKSEEHQMEFYLDYETVNDFESNNFIFMIGVGYKINNWLFKCFITKNKELDSQKEMYNNFWEYVNKILKEHNKLEAIFIHWTSAEPSFYNKSQKQFNLPIKKFMDLNKVFLAEPIVIRGAFNYSLKTIAKCMFKHDLIKTTWPDESSCNNGQDALVLANKLYIESNKDLELTDMNDIVYYNEIDCKVLCDILEYLRLNH